MSKETGTVCGLKKKSGEEGRGRIVTRRDSSLCSRSTAQLELGPVTPTKCPRVRQAPAGTAHSPRAPPAHTRSRRKPLSSSPLRTRDPHPALPSHRPTLPSGRTRHLITPRNWRRRRRRGGRPTSWGTRISRGSPCSLARWGRRQRLPAPIRWMGRTLEGQARRSRSWVEGGGELSAARSGGGRGGRRRAGARAGMGGSARRE